MNPFRTYDKALFIIVLLLIVFGTFMVYSSTAVVAPKGNANVSQYYYLKRHLFTTALGFLMMYLAYRTKPQSLRSLAVPLLIFSIVLLLLVFVPGLGVKAGNARRWLRLWPSTFQPSELVKLSMVIFLARYMSAEGYNTDRLRCFLIPVSVMAIISAVFMRQPDFGATMTLFLITFCMLGISGIRWKYILSLLVLAVPIMVKLLQEPYRLRRIVAFLNPWENAQGSGFQLVQSFIAFGSGGLTGVGLGNSKQKLSFLPEIHTDFIFSMVGEELGFIVASVVVALFGYIFIRGISIAERNNTDRFRFYLAYGISLMIGLQALINFFVVTGLAPTKGLPLPFISYGGSSLLVNMTAIGILLNLSKEAEDRDFLAEKRKKARLMAYRRPA